MKELLVSLMVVLYDLRCVLYYFHILRVQQYKYGLRPKPQLILILTELATRLS